MGQSELSMVCYRTIGVFFSVELGARYQLKTVLDTLISSAQYTPLRNVTDRVSYGTY